MEVVVRSGYLRDVQGSSQIVNTNKPTPSFFCRPHALPVGKRTVSEHCMKNIAFHKPAHPGLIWGFSDIYFDQ